MKQLHSSRLIHCAGLLMVALLWLANSSNPPTGRTGAPFDGSCADCHSGGSFNGDVFITGMPGTVTPNTVYPLQITLDATTGNPSRGGFQLVAVDGSNANAGNLAAVNVQTGTEMSGGREYIEHRGAKTFGGNPITWDFTWTSPAGASGNTIKFYFVGNFTDGSGSMDGDRPLEFLETYTFSGPPPVSAIINTSTPVSCNGGTDGTATVTASGGNPPYTYVWSNGQTSQTADNLSVGNYTVTVTGSGGSGAATATVFIFQPAAIDVAVNISGAISCTQNSASVTALANGGTGSYSYAWSNGTTNSQATYTVGGLQSVTVTDANNCTKVTSFTIQNNIALPNAAATGGMLTCSQPTTTINASSSTSGTTFQWTGPNGFTSTQQMAAVTVPGTYIVTVTNPTNGCTSTATAMVTPNTTPPTITVTGGTLSCDNPSVQLTASSNATSPVFLWSGPCITAANQNQQNPVVNCAGTFTVTVTNPANGCSSTATATVISNATPPTATATPGGSLTCTTTSVPVTSTTNATNATFSWTGPSGFTAATQNINAQTAGNYTVTITSTATGCTATAVATVVQNTTVPTASIAAPISLNCNNAAVQLNALASSQGNNFTYQWTTANGNIVSGATTLTPTVNTAGMYNLLVTNTQNGCTASGTVIVNQSPSVVASIAGTLPVTCNGGSNGSATAQATGGTGGYTYLWSNGTTAATAANLPVGTYIVTITSANTCTATATVTISQPAALVANATATAQTMNGVNDGTATAAPSGGTSGYTFLWSNGATTNQITALSPGNYTVTVTDVHGCTVAQTVTVNSVNCNLTAAVTAVPVTCHGAANGSATVTLTGAALPATYLWSNGAITASVTGLMPGNYTVSITDVNGCPAVGSVSITEPAILQANATATAVSGVNTNDGQAIAQPTGGTSPYTYTWSTGSSTNAINNLLPGNYIVTVTDANSCTVIRTVTVNAFNCALVTSVSTTNATCPESTDGSATILVGGGTAPYTYIWSSGDSLVTANGLAVGTYTVSVTDAAGCSITATATILALDTLAPVLACPGSIFLCGADLVNYSTPAISDNCDLNGSVPILVSGQASGTAFNYGVTTQVFSAADAAGNTATCSFTITVFSIPNILVDSVQNDLGNSSSGSIHVTAVGGTGPYNFSWQKDSVFFSNEEDLTGLQTGHYRLVITDANGCGALAPVFIDNVVGTANPLAQTSIRVWPNPAQTGIWVKTNDLTAFSAEIWNPQGRLVQTMNPAGLSDFLSVEYLPNGVYYLKIVDGAGKTWVVKWVKTGQ